MAGDTLFKKDIRWSRILLCYLTFAICFIPVVLVVSAITLFLRYYPSVNILDALLLGFIISLFGVCVLFFFYFIISFSAYYKEKTYFRIWITDGFLIIDRSGTKFSLKHRIKLSDVSDVTTLSNFYRHEYREEFNDSFFFLNLAFLRLGNIENLVGFLDNTTAPESLLVLRLKKRYKFDMYQYKGRLTKMANVVVLSVDDVPKFRSLLGK